MRVVFVNQFYAPAKGATAQLLTDVAESLARTGIDVSVICGDRSYPDPVRIRAAGRFSNGVRVRRIPVWFSAAGGWFGRLVQGTSFAVGAALHLMSMPRPDLVITLTSPPMIPIVGFVAARLRSAKSYNWVMDHYPDVAFALGHLSPRSLTGRLLESMSGQVLRRSDRVIALGDTMARHLAELSGRAVEVVYEWADGRLIRPCPVEGHPLRSDWGWDGRFVVLYSGHLGLAHEFDTALGAAMLLRDRPEVHFAFIGTGPRAAEVECKARRLGLRNVEFRPLVERGDLGRSLTAADVHLVTMRNEVAGLLVPAKIYGALASGRPCIFVGPAECEVSSFLSEGCCGTRVAVGDAEGLAAAARRYLDEPSTLAEEGRRARALFERRFDMPRAMRAFRELVEQR